MLWHIVTFHFAPDADEADRRSLVTALAGLAESIPEVRFLRVAPSLDDPDVLGLLSGFDDAAALRTYATHEAHLPVIALAAEVCDEVSRLDVLTDDPTDALSRT